MPERIECVDDRPLLVADHPHFLESKDQNIGYIAEYLTAVGIDLGQTGSCRRSPKSAAVTASLEADELAVGIDHLRVSPESWGSAV
jgi:hypothetical protein